MANKVYFAKVRIKQYDENGNWWIVMQDGNFLAKQCFHSVESAQNWMKTCYPLTEFEIVVDKFVELGFGEK